MNTENTIRFYNPKTNQVRYMPFHCERALKSIGFYPQEEPKPLDELKADELKKTTTKKTKNVNN